jgi:hypothetical protein
MDLRLEAPEKSLLSHKTLEENVKQQVVGNDLMMPIMTCLFKEMRRVMKARVRIED